MTEQDHQDHVFKIYQEADSALTARQVWMMTEPRLNLLEVERAVAALVRQGKLRRTSRNYYVIIPPVKEA